MLYLEDYVELIEHLPIDLREKFSDMREMDVQIHGTVDQLNSKVKDLFKQCAARKAKTENADEVFGEIKDGYHRALEDADEKVQLANQIYDLVDRHLRKLDQELAKFKMELEADNAGITEILERRSLELDNHTSHGSGGSLHKRRHIAALGISNSQVTTTTATLNGAPVEKKIKTELPSDLGLFRSESAPPSVFQSQDSSAPPSGNDSDVSNSRPSSRNSIPGCSQAQVSSLQLAAAAQAVQATAEMQVGRRTSSLKASYEAVKGNEFPLKVQTQEEIQQPSSVVTITDSQASVVEDLIDEDSSHSQGDALTSPGLGQISRPSRTKKQTSKAAAWNQERMQAEARRGHAREKDQSTNVSPNTSVVELASEGGQAVAEWSCDPNEPRYCMCNQVSYGEMVGCDNEKCTIEWFHYGCVGLTEAPKGKWYCPQCTQTMKRRNRNR